MQLVSSQAKSINSSFKAEPITLSIIVAAYNEAEMLPLFHYELSKVLATLPNENIEILYINDGSEDQTWQVMQQLPAHHATIELINLSRNFGKEAAMTAGLDLAKGQSAILLDADLQDPPELIPQMLATWREGADVVNMKRKERLGESSLKKLSAHLYYRLLAQLSDVKIEKDVGDFRLLSRRVIDEIKNLPERNRYMKGIMAWPGFKQTVITFDRPERAAGETKWSFIQLVQLGLSGITSFSVRPLRIATWLGILVSASAFIFSLFVFIKALLLGDPVAGYPSLMLVQLWLGGVQLMAIGLLGEYVGRIFTETKQRPVYLVMENLSKKAQKAGIMHG
ncbi:glycosyltransferase family 2 protein [Thalassotalea atypica]|uniref:glycosyltransferase family 2 protein n=1 Tax=Thalassotalea atypica TaxID=2054316 RepID=UPI002573A77D|nr:glycosyltransferase family 2 protein [Thalassotalea atypica]